MQILGNVMICDGTHTAFWSSNMRTKSPTTFLALDLVSIQLILCLGANKIRFRRDHPGFIVILEFARHKWLENSCKPTPKKTISPKTILRSELQCCNLVRAKLWWSFASLKSHSLAEMAGLELQFGITPMQRNTLILLERRRSDPISKSTISATLTSFKNV